METARTLTLIEAVRLFSDEDYAEEMFIEARWPNGVGCLECGSEQPELFRQRVGQLTETQAAVLGVLISVETRGGIWVSGSQKVTAQCHAMTVSSP